MIDSLLRSSLLLPEEVLKLWPELEPHIEAALDHSVGEMTTFDVCLLALVEKVHIWVTRDTDNALVSVIVTRFNTHMRGKHMQIMTCGGKIQGWDAWTAHHKTLETFARENGCSAIQIWGRKGWERRLRHLTSDTGNKYEPLYHVYNLEI